LGEWPEGNAPPVDFQGKALRLFSLGPSFGEMDYHIKCKKRINKKEKQFIRR
jgi:hypothetical protein